MKNSSNNRSRTHECYDPVHSRSWDPDVRVAICADQSIIDSSDHSLWVGRTLITIMSFWTQRWSILGRISSGSYVSLLSNPMMEFGDTKDVGRRLGMFMTILSLGALAGPPISGAINTATGGFEAVGYYAGGIPSLWSLLVSLLT